jgi:hypothetical protein
MLAPAPSLIRVRRKPSSAATAVGGLGESLRNISEAKRNWVTLHVEKMAEFEFLRNSEALLVAGEVIFASCCANSGAEFRYFSF